MNSKEFQDAIQAAEEEMFALSAIRDAKQSEYYAAQDAVKKARVKVMRLRDEYNVAMARKWVAIARANEDRLV